MAGGAFATFKDAVICCVATLPAVAVEVAEIGVAAVEIFAWEEARTGTTALT